MVKGKQAIMARRLSGSPVKSSGKDWVCLRSAELPTCGIVVFGCTVTGDAVASARTIVQFPGHVFERCTVRLAGHAV
ncbi:hypothetical protein DEDE109153_09345 [Deinococcus deserti]